MHTLTRQKIVKKRTTTPKPIQHGVERKAKEQNYCVEWKIYTYIHKHRTGNSINREVVEYTYMHSTVNIVLHTNVCRATAARRAANASQTTTSLFVCYLRFMNQLIEIVLLLRTSRRCVTTFSLFFFVTSAIHQH